MKRLRWIALLLTIVPAALAQREPHAAYVYPAGGQVGTTVDVIVGGQNLYGATNAYVSGPGVTAVVLPYEPPITFREADMLRERMQELRKQGNAAAILKEITEIRRKLAVFEKRRQNPALGDSIPVRISIAPNAPPGNRELRLGSFNALSNPLVFQIGQLPEFHEPEFKEEVRPLRRQTGDGRSTNTNAPATVITLPATVNGQILPGEVDRFKFKAKRGDQLVIVVSARELIPYLADAVPGWFQAKVVLYDANGKELAFNDDYQFHPDPVLFYNIQKEGEYILEIKDSLYRGREDFVYRIAIGELPFVSNIFPLGGRAGSQTTVAIWGWNLPVKQYTLNLTGVPPGAYPFTVPNKGLLSNRVSFQVDTLPECFAQPSCNSPTNAQHVTLPIIVNGHIDKPGDMDVFRFEGKAGDQIVAEVYARRLDSPLDSALKLTDATGKQIAFNDDHEDKGTGLNTHHADSYIFATLPTTGTYFLYLWDTQQKGGWEYCYRLRISPPRPDFELRAVPSSLCIRPGGSASLTVYTLRRDGCTNTISLALKDPPEGYKLSAASLVGTQDQVKVTLSTTTKGIKAITNITIEGRANILGREVVHPAVPADDMMQAFAYRHLVCASELKVAMATPPPRRPVEKVAETKKTAPTTGPSVKIPAGGVARVQVKLPTTTYTGKLQLELEEPPEGVVIQSFTTLRDSVEIALRADPTKIKPGQKGALTVNAFAERTNVKPAEAKQQRARLGALPPIQFEIVAQ